METVGIILAAIVANSLASVSMRILTDGTPIEASLHGVSKVLSTPYFYVAGALYGVALILFTLAVSRMELSLTYSTIVSGAIVLVTLISFLLFREPVTLFKLLGIALILGGVFLIHRPA